MERLNGLKLQIHWRQVELDNLNDVIKGDKITANRVVANTVGGCLRTMSESETSKKKKKKKKI